MSEYLTIKKKDRTTDPSANQKATRNGHHSTFNLYSFCMFKTTSDMIVTINRKS